MKKHVESEKALFSKQAKVLAQRSAPAFTWQKYSKHLARHVFYNPDLTFQIMVHLFWLIFPQVLLLRGAVMWAIVTGQFKWAALKYSNKWRCCMFGAMHGCSFTSVFDARPGRAVKNK